MRKVPKYLLIRKDLKPLKPALLRFLAVLAFYVASLNIMSASVSLAGMRYPKNSYVLPDLGFDALPVYRSDSAADIFGLVASLATVFRVLFHRKGATILRRIFVTHGITSLLRAICIVATSYPDPSEACQTFQPESASSVWGFWVKAVYKPGNLSCGDLMFSGHCMLLILLGLFWQNYMYFWESLAFWGISLSGCLMLLVARVHYTNDIIIAIYVSWTTFQLYHIYATNLDYRKKFRLLSWLEADISKKKEPLMESSSSSLEVV